MTTTTAAGYTQRGASLLVLAALTMAPTIAAADECGVTTDPRACAGGELRPAY